MISKITPQNKSFAGLSLILNVVLVLTFLFLLSSCRLFKPQQAKNNAAFEQEINSLMLDANKDLMLEKPEEALEKYKQIIKKQPKNATAHFQMARLLMASENYNKAIREIKLAEKYDPNNKWILDLYASLMVKDKQFLKAAELYGRLAKMENNPEDYLNKQAMSYTWAGKYKKSIETFNQIQAMSAEYDERIQAVKVQLFLELNEVDSAIQIINELIAHNPEEISYRATLSSIYLNQGDQNKAVEVFKSYSDSYPEDLLAQIGMSYVYMKQDSTKFFNYLDTVIYKSNNSVDEKLELLNTIIKFQKDEKSTINKKINNEYLEYLTTIDTVTGNAKLLAAFIALDKNDIEKGKFYLKESIKLDTLNMRRWGMLIELYSGEEADSILYYSKKAQELFPDAAPFYYYAAYGYLYKKNNEKLIEECKEGLEHTQDTDTFYNITFNSFIADAYMSLEDFSNAELYYEKALAIDENNIYVLNNYSYILAEQGKDLDKALKMSEITLKGGNVKSYYLDTYAWILYKKGEYKEAKKYIQKALEHSDKSDDSVMLEHLGDIELKLGNREAALKAWQEALLIDPESKTLKEKLQP